MFTHFVLYHVFAYKTFKHKLGSYLYSMCWFVYICSLNGNFISVLCREVSINELFNQKAS